MRGMLKLFVVWGVLSQACTNIGDFSTGAGECYEGVVVSDLSVRRGIEPDVRMVLTIDVDALTRGNDLATEPLDQLAQPAARISTSDGQFEQTPVAQMLQLPHDSLSLFQFPGGRVRNYLAYAVTNTGALVTVIVSLMENDEVEVRVLRPLVGDHPALFGVFRLSLKDKCE